MLHNVAHLRVRPSLRLRVYVTLTAMDVRNERGFVPASEPAWLCGDKDAVSYFGARARGHSGARHCQTSERSRPQVREGARRIAALEAALAQARARRAPPQASGAQRAGAGGHGSAREARQASELQARSLCRPAAPSGAALQRVGRRASACRRALQRAACTALGERMPKYRASIAQRGLQ